MKNISFKKLLMLLPLLLVGCSSVQEEPEPIVVDDGLYAVAELPTPVFSEPDIPALFNIIEQDGENIIEGIDDWASFDPLQTILIKGEVLEIHNELEFGDKTVYEITAEAYPSEDKLYILAEFAQVLSSKLDTRDSRNYSKDDIIENLKEWEGSPYFWGGSLKEGLIEMLDIMPPSLELNELRNSQYTLVGGDCSGILYDATDGATPRNTSDLVSFGDPVEIEGKSIDKIVDSLELLDMIVWQGHSAYVIEIDEEEGPIVIESRFEYNTQFNGEEFEDVDEDRIHGVKTMPAKDFLTFFIEEEEKLPVNDYHDTSSLELDEEGNAPARLVVRRLSGIFE